MDRTFGRIQNSKSYVSDSWWHLAAHLALFVTAVFEKCKRVDTVK
jgi:hypothetical protein